MFTQAIVAAAALEAGSDSLIKRRHRERVVVGGRQALSECLVTKIRRLPFHTISARSSDVVSIIASMDGCRVGLERVQNVVRSRKRTSQ